MPVSPEEVVRPPEHAPPLHSLLQSAVIIEEPPSSRWEGGFVFKPEGCTEADIFNPCAETSEIVQIVVDATSGTWEATHDGNTTPALAFDIDAFDLQTALEALASIGAGNVIVTGGPGDDGGTVPYTVTFTGDLFGIDVPDLTAASIDLAGGAASATATVIQQGGEEVVKSQFFDPTSDVFVEPTIVEVPYTCSTFGWEEEDYQGKALRALERGKSKAIECEFWTGAHNPLNPSLVRGTPNDDDHVLNPGGAATPTAVSPGIALMLLAQALANCGSGGRGMIHATPALAERWASFLTIGTEDGLLVTLSRGDIVVSGTGYPGTGPLGQPPPGPNEAWAYATGIVDIRLGDPELIPDNLEEAIERSTNTVTFRGECTAAAADDLCCRFAVLVDLCGGF